MIKAFKEPETSLSPQKPQNILVRYNCSKNARGDSNYEHPERSYLLKYSPKYYQSLTIEITQENPLLSRIKKVKKLKTFTGLFKKRNNISPTLWLNLFGSCRKEIEEIPRIASTYLNPMDKDFSWTKLYEQSSRFFLNITRLGVQRGGDHLAVYDRFVSSTTKESYVRYLKNMRKLKELKISVSYRNYHNIKWIFEKLDQMDRLLGRLEHLRLEVKERDLPISELLENKNVASYLTDLKFPETVNWFDSSYCVIPQVCLNLRSLSIGFDRFFIEYSEFPNFLVSLQKLPKLTSLQFGWSRDLKLFWGCFKPQSSLKYLALSFDASEILTKGLFGNGDLLKSKDTTASLYADLMKNWDQDIKELESLQFNMSWNNPQDLIISKFFITGVLKKVRKLTSFKCQVDRYVKDIERSDEYDPFFVDEVPHLHETLERFETSITCSMEFRYHRSHVIFDVEKLLFPFVNLKRIKLAGEEFSKVKMEAAIGKLQESQKEGEFPMLEFEEIRINTHENLRNILERISGARRREKNLKIMLNLCYGASSECDELERLLEVIQEIKTIKGLVICLNFSVSKSDCEDYKEPDIDGIRRSLEKYPEIRNLIVSIDYTYDEIKIEYIKIDGEKEQFFADCF